MTTSRITKSASQTIEKVGGTASAVITASLENSKAVTAKELSLFLLKLAVAGVLISAVLVAPGLGMLARYFPNADRAEKQRIKRRIKILQRQGYFKTRAERDVVTRKGKTYINALALDQLIFVPPQNWDGSWFVVMFDIPARKGKVRHLLREQLQRIGFVAYQDSVYVYPYDCRALIKEIEALLHLEYCIQTMVVTKLDGQQQLQTEFGLN